MGSDQKCVEIQQPRTVSSYSPWAACGSQKRFSCQLADSEARAPLTDSNSEAIVIPSHPPVSFQGQRYCGWLVAVAPTWSSGVLQEIVFGAPFVCYQFQVSFTEMCIYKFIGWGGSAARAKNRDRASASLPELSLSVPPPPPAFFDA